MLYAISRNYGKDSIIVSEGVYHNREDAKKRCWELANEAKTRIAKAYKISEDDVRIAEDWTGIIGIKWQAHSNMFEVVELEEH